MADPSVAPVSSIKSRIAALNLEKVHHPEPGAPPPYSFEHAAVKKSRPPPPPPSKRPSIEPRSQTTNNPPLQSNGTTSTRAIGNQPINGSDNAPKKQQPALPPRLPPRTNSNVASQPAPPSLPPRKASEHSIRTKGSVESISTIASGRSAVSVGSTRTSFSGASGGEGQQYRVKAPPYDPSKLPPLPPKKAKEEPKPTPSRTALKPTRSSPSVVEKTEPRAFQPPPVLPSRPPLPSRQSTTPNPVSAHIAPPKRSALSFGLNKNLETPPPLPPSRPGPDSAGSPPPIPLSSRPNLAALQASKPKSTSSCLVCRDFSAPDAHAARFPRQTLPTQDLSWLATQLTSPFPSLTDRARTLFTWLHHNIDYNVADFFSGNLKPSTPASTLSTGLAVCEGYAALFTALATHCGLESVVIGGHGKGFGHSALTPGAPIPPFNAGHAWNAVRIDGGEWKLIDCCWGAGNVGGGGSGQAYERNFKPQFFSMPNNEFAARHFPEDNELQFRTDGRVMGWEEYMLDDAGERVQVYGGCFPEHGIGERTFQPEFRHVKADAGAGELVRFRFGKVCEHWENERCGRGKMYPMVLHVPGVGGGKEDYLAFETDGRVWWVDVPRRELGRAGQRVSVFAVTSMGGRDARGVSVGEYKSKKGRVGMGFGGVCAWDLV
ncbi:hypothetical protein BU16DRAFT_497797 [Lophium mytilinum]|uniref:Transglutaminase-like domain-containing protein n=1 Tax=Lophium mytilinum TaxID=390894 RepID=A0A6A6RCE7_9PEZI|nr:hypothetical protein BU16DRAFT_497797 [Lophium mytilinum]